MTKLKVQAFSISIDGFGAGPQQSLEHPLGVGGLTLHEWFFPTRTFQQMTGGEGGSTDADDAFARRSLANIGAWIMGRNMFGPVRGPWPDARWTGWWGDSPPYHVPVFVLTHHPRPSLTMQGGTVFHFVTGGIDEALHRARAAAGERDVRVGGGVATVRQFLEAGLLDEIHLVLAPTVLGHGEELLAGVDLARLGFRCIEHVGTANAMHVVLAKA